MISANLSSSILFCVFLFFCVLFGCSVLFSFLDIFDLLVVFLVNLVSAVLFSLFFASFSSFLFFSVSWVSSTTLRGLPLPLFTLTSSSFFSLRGLPLPLFFSSTTTSFFSISFFSIPFFSFFVSDCAFFCISINFLYLVLPFWSIFLVLAFSEFTISDIIFVSSLAYILSNLFIYFSSAKSFLFKYFTFFSISSLLDSFFSILTGLVEFEIP